MQYFLFCFLPGVVTDDFVTASVVVTGAVVDGVVVGIVVDGFVVGIVVVRREVVVGVVVVGVVIVGVVVMGIQLLGRATRPHKSPTKRMTPKPDKMPIMRTVFDKLRAVLFSESIISILNINKTKTKRISKNFKIYL
jgi:hypothetical protein